MEKGTQNIVLKSQMWILLENGKQRSVKSLKSKFISMCKPPQCQKKVHSEFMNFMNLKGKIPSNSWKILRDEWKSMEIADSQSD